MATPMAKLIPNRRIQNFAVRFQKVYILDKAKMELARPDMLVLHPLPRVNEISVEVDADPRAAYFKQADYGVKVRMALILSLLGLGVELC